MDENFSIELQARLNEAKTKANIDTSLKNVKGLEINIEHVTLQQSALSDLKKTVKNNTVQIKTNLDTSNIKQQTQNIGKNIGGVINKNMAAAISNSKNEIAKIKKEISSVSNSLKGNKLKGLNEIFNLKRPTVEPFVKNEIAQLTKDVNNLISAMASKPVTGGLLDEYAAKMKLIRDLVKEYGTVKADMAPYQHLIDSARYFDGKKIFISDMDKSSVLSGTGVDNVKQLNNEMRNMGVCFTYASKGASRLDGIWNEFINSTGNKGLSNITNSADQISCVVGLLRDARDVLYGDKLYENAYGSPEWNNVKSWTESVKENLIRLNTLREKQKAIEKEAAEISSAAANTITANERKKQTEYSKTEKAREKSGGKPAFGQILSTSDLDKQGKIYIQKISGTIEKAKSTVERKLKQAGYTDIKITGFEKANGQIKSLSVTAADAAGALKKLNFERAKLQGNGKAKSGLVQTDTVKVFGNISESVSAARAKLESLKAKWREQGIYTDELKQKVISLENELSNISSNGDMSSFKENLKSVESYASNAQKKLSEMTKTAAGIQYKIDTGSYSAQVNSLVSDLRKFGQGNSEAQSRIQALTDSYKNLINTSKEFAATGDSGKLIQAQKQLQKEFDTSKNKIKELSISGAKVDIIKNTKLSSNIEEWLQKNSRAAKDFGDRLQQMRADLQGADQVKLGNIKEQFESIKAQARAAGQLGKSCRDTFKNLYSTFSMWFGTTALIMRGINSVKSGITTVYNLDTALVDLKKTTTMTNGELENFYYSSNETAKQMGVTTEEILTQASAWSRLGSCTHTDLLYGNI